MMQNIKKKINHWRNHRKRVKAVKHIKKVLKKVFSKKNTIKIVMSFLALALIGSYVLPYVL